jgi:EAL domain-containing protein (putative c-di-GMP-specific phosphodiesterase class I)
MSSCKSCLDDIIANKSIEVHFQPVVSIIKKCVVGFEGLSRGVIHTEDLLIEPLKLFKEAAKSKKTLSLDRLCRERVIEEFQELHSKNKDLLLFLNIDGSIMTDEIVGSGNVVNLISKHNFKPENIVIEIIESKVNNIEALHKFVNLYRSYGFLICLDDVGSGHSNLDRISIAEPDIIKIDRRIVRNMHLDYYKQEVFKSLVSLSKSLGSLIVAEGVESEEEALKAIELGADMLQGYYFGSPQKLSGNMIKTFNLPIRRVALNYSSYLAEKINNQKSRHKEFSDIIKDVLLNLAAVEEKRIDFELLNIISKYKMFECIYILDPSGIQVSDTVTQYINCTKHKNLIFQPAKKGEDHSLKKYYYFLRNMRLSKYLSEPYISLATGNLCITMSCVFKTSENKKFILCIDINPSYLNI